MTRRVLVHSAIVLLAAAVAHVSCNLSDLEGIHELVLVSEWVQYLSERQIRDQDGNLLQEKYFIDSDGVSHSSELSHESHDTFGDLKKLVGWKGGGDGMINATALRHEPNITDNSYTRVWARIARDMLRTIDGAKLEGNGAELLAEFKKHVFNPWQNVIYARYNSILRVDRQDALHLAILKAHQDFYVLVCQRMREKLPAEMAKFLPKLTQWPNPHQRIQLDHIQWELKALRKYRDLRKSLENELSPEELESVIEVLPVPVQDTVYKFEVNPQMASLLEEIGDEREISAKYLVKLDESGKIEEETGLELDEQNSAELSRRCVWRAIHRGLRVLGRHIIQAIDPDDVRRRDLSSMEMLRVILSSLKEAVLQRVYALNGMMDNSIDQDSIENFLSQRDNLNELFDQLSDELAQEKRPFWFGLLGSLNLVRETSEDGAPSNRFHLRVERESLRIDAEHLFSHAMDQLAGVSTGIKPVAEALKGVALEAINSYQGDEIRQRLRQAFGELKRELTRIKAGGTSQETDADKLREAQWQAAESLRDFYTYISAYAIRTGHQRLPVLVADVIESSRGLV